MSNRRGHFKAADIRKLKERVNHQCSRPECKAATSGPGTDLSVLTVGTAAHICAASPQGPRYDAQQMDVERNNIANAIWLCNNCAREIDLDPKRFTIELLRRWKNDAESYAMTRLGRRLPSSDDNNKALAGAFLGHAPSVLWDSINRIHCATQQAWEALDPRFKVTTSYINGVQTIRLNAQEEVPLQLTVHSDFLNKFAVEQKKFFRQGKKVEIDLTGVSFSGSRLIETIMEFRSGKMVISPLAIESRLKVYLHDSENNPVDTMDDILGETTLGTEIFNFHGSAFDKLFNVDFSHPIDGHGQPLKLNINLTLNNWINRDLNDLPYFNKIKALFDQLKDGCSLVLKMEIRGEPVFTTNISSFDKGDFVNDQFWFFSYIDICRKIAKILKVNVFYKDDLELSLDNYEELHIILSRLERRREFKAERLKENLKCVMTLPTENRSLLDLSSGQVRECRIEYPSTQTINIFNTLIELPPLIRQISNVTPKIVRVINSREREDEIEVEFIPASGFLYAEIYQ